MNPPFDNEPVVKSERHVEFINEFMNDYEKEKNKIEKEETKSYLEELEADFPHVKVAYKAFMCDPNTHLFIAVRNKRAGADSCTIYSFTKQNSRLIIPTKKEIESKILSEIISKWDKLREHIIKQRENDIIRTGTDFYEWLLKDVLPNGCNRMCEVWIYCEDADIDPIWEWLYIEEREFFWGDEFSIVRIQKGCDMSKKCTLNKLIILKDDCLLDTAEYRTTSFIPNLKYLKSSLHISLESFKNLVVDDAPELLKSCMLYFPMDISGAVRVDLEKIFRNKNNKNLLLYPHTQLMGFNNYPSTWIDSRLNVPKSQTSQFFKYFCDVLDGHLAKAEEANIAKIVTETRKKMCSQELNDQGGYNSCGLWKFLLAAFVALHLRPAREESKAIGFWRLAYVVNGNPRTYLGFAQVRKVEGVNSSVSGRGQ